MKYYSFKEIIKSLPVKKNKRSSIWVKLIVRRISFLFTYFFINLGWTANMVSLLSLVVVATGAALLCINTFVCRLIGVILINFWLILDCVDGNIARCKKQKTFMGEFYDALSGYGAHAFSVIGVSVAAYYTSSLLFANFGYLFIIIGAVSSLMNICARLIHQKYQYCYIMANCALEDYARISNNETTNPSKFARFRVRIDKELGLSGLFMPWLFVALFTNTFEFMLCFYSLFFICSFIMVVLLYCKRATNFEADVQQQLLLKE